MRFIRSFAVVMLAAGTAGARMPAPDYQSCDLTAQHAFKGQIGGSIREAGQAHISGRADILQADIGTARKGGRLGQRQADRAWKRVQAVRTSTDTFANRQGFLSAAERASYDRELDAVSRLICRR